MADTIYKIKEIVVRPYQISDAENLLNYFYQLSQETKNRFGPHPFSIEGIKEKFEQQDKFRLFIALNSNTNHIVAYSIIKIGWLDFDASRLSNYGLMQDDKFDCTFAPSVADDWQSKGVGSLLFKYVLIELKSQHNIRRIILWGGVQSDNFKAVNFYKKFNFKILGEFDHNGKNLDMMLELMK